MEHENTQSPIPEASVQESSASHSPVDLDKLVHDVKTPLATIRALTQLTVTQLRKKGEDGIADRLSKVDTQVERIRTLLHDALTASYQRGAEE